MAASVHTAVFWDAVPCSPVDTGVRFADAYCLVVLMIEAVTYTPLKRQPLSIWSLVSNVYLIF
jgi:uncharacterized membrane protein